MFEGRMHSNRTAAPSPAPAASSPTGSSHAPHRTLFLTPITHTSKGGTASSPATSSLGPSSNPVLGLSEARTSGSTSRYPSSTSHQSTTSSASPRSNLFSSANRPLQQFPPSSTPAAAATLAAASLPKVKLQPSPFSPAGTAAGTSVPALASGSTTPDARTLTTSFTTHDIKTAKQVHAPGQRNLRVPPTSFVASATSSLPPLLPPFGFSSPSLSSGLRIITSTSPTQDEQSPVAPTPPPKSPRTFSSPALHPGYHSSTRLPSGHLDSVFMGGSQSKPAAATSNFPVARSQPSSQKLQKANPHQQTQHAPPTTSSTLSTGATATHGRVSRSPSPAPTPSSSAPSTSFQSQSQSALAAPRLQLASSSTFSAPSMSGSSPSASASSKLKRAFAARRKKSGDASTSLSMFGLSTAASTVSLVQHPKGNAEVEEVTFRATAQKQLASQLLGPSVNSAPSSGLAKVPSKTLAVPVLVRSSEVATSSTVEDTATASLLSPWGTTDGTCQASGGSHGRSRGSIIQLSPGIASAVDYMREIVAAEEEGKQRGRDGVGRLKEKLDQNDQVRGVDDGRKTDEGPGAGDGGGQTSSSSSSYSMPTVVASPPSPSSLQFSAPLSLVEKEVEFREREGREQGGEAKEQKESWRKSDSTIGHHTLRGAGIGVNTTRTSRPVSMAESFQSAYTIVPGGGGGPGSVGGNKRWSTVTGDLDFQVMMEEAAEEEEEGTASGSGLKTDEMKSTLVPSAKTINRRSLSLNVGISTSAKPLIAPAYVNVGAKGHRTSEPEARPISYSISEGPSGPVRSPTAAAGTPPNSHAHSTTKLPHQLYQAPSSHIQSQSMSQLHTHQQLQIGTLPFSAPVGKVPAWIVTPPAENFPRPPRALNPNLPPPTMTNNHGPFSTAPVSFRQTAISMSNGFAKRAAEKIGGIGKKWGISTSSSGSGYSSSSSSRDHGAQASSYSSSQFQPDHGVPLGRTHSNQSSLASSMKSAASLSSGITSGVVHHVHLPGRDKNKDKKKRRTPNAPSGAYSVASSVTSASTSESDGMPLGPVLGRLVRAPVKYTGGVVFGRDLKTVVSQTRAVAVLSEERRPSNRQEGEREKLVKDLEHRMLPALVVRCVQHILIWGIQEEGLFRVSGRASHVARLRCEFDTGVDYDLSGCAPGDLDPHAVASIFKAYLRELPESILTNKLHRVFESALSKELASNSLRLAALDKQAAHPTPDMPTGSKANFDNSIRKAPSLSTLAMPSFNGMPPASRTLIYALRSLIAQLPLENCDLMRTVVELIRATAKASKDTKMPLSNLLLVFCPSLNMSPPLLKALCEAEGIWDEFPEEVLDIKRETMILEGSGDRIQVDDDDDDYLDAHEGLDSERQSFQSMDQPPSEHPSSEYNASAENSMFEEAPPASRKRIARQRPIVPTLYLDSQSRCSSSSLSSTPDDAEPFSMQSDLVFSPHLPSSSTDSLETPASSGHPSLIHLPLKDSKDNLMPQTSRKSPKIFEAMRSSDRKPSHQPTISMPISIDPMSVQFPTTPPTPKKRLSIPLFSLASFSQINPSAEPPSPTASSSLRGKKPSLRRLFTKRSTASIGSNSSNGRYSGLLTPDGGFDSPYLNLPRSASDSSSVSTPLSAVTAPQPSTPQLPPVLDTPIESPSLKLALGLDISPSESSEDLLSSVLGTTNTDTTSYVSARTSQVSIDCSTTPPLEAQSDYEVHRPRLHSANSVSSLNHLGLLDSDGEDQEDWTRSVLNAVGAEHNLKEPASLNMTK